MVKFHLFAIYFLEDFPKKVLAWHKIHKYSFDN